jgi:hypothetical protein
MLHKGIFILGGLAVKGIVVAGHAIGHAWIAHNVAEAAAAKTALGAVTHSAMTHPLATAAIATAGIATPILTIAYFDMNTAAEILAQNPDAASAKAVKFSIAGRLVNGEFTTITGPLNCRNDLILLGSFDEAREKTLTHRLVKAQKVEPELANAYGRGNLIVFS